MTVLSLTDFILFYFFSLTDFNGHYITILCCCFLNLDSISRLIYALIYVSKNVLIRIHGWRIYFLRSWISESVFGLKEKKIKLPLALGTQNSSQGKLNPGINFVVLGVEWSDLAPLVCRVVCWGYPENVWLDLHIGGVPARGWLPLSSQRVILQIQDTVSWVLPCI